MDKVSVFTRNMDSLGRLVIPIYLRNYLKIGIGDSIEVFTYSEGIMLRKYKMNSCVFCESMDQVQYFKSQFVCGGCRNNLAGKRSS